MRFVARNFYGLCGLCLVVICFCLVCVDADLLRDHTVKDRVLECYTQTL